MIKPNAFTEIGKLLAVPNDLFCSSVNEANNKFVDCLTTLHSINMSFQFLFAAVAFFAYSFSSNPNNAAGSFLDNAKARYANILSVSITC